MKSGFYLQGTVPYGLKTALPLFLMVWLLALPCHGQEIQPRRWNHLPMGTNFAGGAYTFTTGEILFDPALRIEDAEFDLHAAGANYIRTFGLFGKSARIDFTQAYLNGTWTGLLDGQPATVKRDGWSDTSVRFAMNLFGAPPLKGREYVEYRTQAKRETIVGAGLVVQLPTGQYFNDKLINLGSNRVTFRPQIGVVHNHGKWSQEVTAALWIFTENKDFFNGKRLEQDPSFGIDAHLIYTFRPGLWLAVGVGFLGWGETSVNGVPSDNSQSNYGYGLNLGIPVNRAFGIKLSYIGLRTTVDTGLDSDTFGMAGSVIW